MLIHGSWLTSTYSPAYSSHRGLSFMDLFGQVVRREVKEKGERKFRKISLLVSLFGGLSAGHSSISQDALHQIHTSHWNEEEDGIGAQGKFKSVLDHNQITLQLFLRPEFAPGCWLLQVRAMSLLSLKFHRPSSIA